MYYTPPVERLIAELGKLPGIGPKSAQRLALHLIKVPAREAEALAGAIVEELLSGLPHIPAHLSEYRAHCWTLGQRVRFMAGQQEGTGMARSITDTGALVVHTETGPVLLNTGEAQVRGLDGGYW